MNTTEFTAIAVDFTSITDVAKLSELAAIKTHMVLSVIKQDFTTVLSVGNSLVAYGLADLGYKVYIIDDRLFLHKNIVYITEPTQKYDLVLAMDQATTYCDSNDKQQAKVKLFASYTKKYFVTTVMDYKNTTNRIFEEPFYIKTGNDERVVLHHRKWDNNDRQAWTHYTYITDENHVTTMHGPYNRRTMYFKQLAKFLFDNGVKKYNVHKEPLYKGVYSKTFQHIVTAEF